MWYAYCDILNSYYYHMVVIESFGRERSPASDVDRMPSFARHELLHLGNTRTEYPKQASQFTTILSINLYVLHFNHRRLKICENFQNINPNFPFNNMWELSKPTKNMHFMELEKNHPSSPLVWWSLHLLRSHLVLTLFLFWNFFDWDMRVIKVFKWSFNSLNSRADPCAATVIGG